MSFLAASSGDPAVSLKAAAGAEKIPPRTHVLAEPPGQGCSPVVSPAPTAADLPFHPWGTGMLIPAARSVA